MLSASHSLRKLRFIAVFGLVSRLLIGQITPPNLALNTLGTGFPSPSSSDSGWGGGTNKWELVDGREGYTDTFSHGLAFTGGHQTAAGGPPYQEPCGVR